MRPGEGERLQRAREAASAAYGEGGGTDPGSTAGTGGPPPGLEPALARLRVLAGGPPAGARRDGPAWRRGLRRLASRLLRFETWWLRESDRAAAAAIGGLAARVEDLFRRLEQQEAAAAAAAAARRESEARAAAGLSTWQEETAAALAGLAEGQRRLETELAGAVRQAGKAAREAGAAAARGVKDLGRSLERTRNAVRQAGDRLDKLHRGLLEAANRVTRLEHERATREELRPLADRLQAAAASLEGLRAETARQGRDLAEQGRRVESHRQRMERGESHLEELSAAREMDQPEIDAVAFMSRFRGSEEEIRRRLRPYADLLSASEAARRGPILEIGCGRGEFLDICREAKLPARAVEIDPVLARPVAARGHRVMIGDALQELQAADPGSLGAVFSAQVIEHLPPGAVTRLVAAAHAALRPGGLLILETLNPASLSVLATTFYRDPGHRAPLHPDTAAFLLESAGFVQVRVTLQSPVPREHALAPIPPGGDEDTRERLNRNLGVLNDLLFGPREYHVVGERP